MTPPIRLEAAAKTPRCSGDLSPAFWSHMLPPGEAKTLRVERDFPWKPTRRRLGEQEAPGEEPSNLPAPGGVEFSVATGCLRAGSQLPRAGGRRSERSEGRLGRGGGGWLLRDGGMERGARRGPMQVGRW